jgi:membrane-associated protease RseP (regulator of RpoE activity)
MKKLILTTALFAVLGGLAIAGSGRGYMGVTVVGVNNDMSGEHDNGVYISTVQPGSGAEAAGLAENDRILTLNGVSISALPDLDSAMAANTPGQSVTITVVRGEDQHTFDVLLGDKPKMDMPFGSHNDMGFGKWVIEAAGRIPRIGVALQPLEGQLAAYFDVSSGMLVTRVLDDSGAWRAGLQAGDVLLDVGGKSAGSVHDIHSALQDYEPGDTVDVTVQRRGDINRFAVTLDKAANLSTGEMTFNVAFGPGERGDGLHHDGNVELRMINEVAGGNGEAVTVRFGAADDEDALRHQIHQIEKELHHLQEQLHHLQND